jgi:hypothetical protein
MSPKMAELVPENSHEVIRITHLEAGKKMEEVQCVEDVLYQWVKENHLECLKTELIFNEIFLVI